MMLHLIEGGAGSGKSTVIRQQIESLLAQQTGEILLIVPEQFTFETERDCYDSFGIRAMERVRVLSFLRLAEEIFRACGGLAGRHADDMAKMLTMRLAIKNAAPFLQLYDRATLRPELVTELIEIVSEMKNAAATPEQLNETANRLPRGLLSDKLRDLSLLQESYDALLSRQFEDTADTLTRAAALSAEHRFFAGKHIFLDAFKSFTAVQEALIAQMLRQAADVTAALCIGEGSYGLFDGVKETRRRLIELTRSCGTSVAKPMTLHALPRFHSEAIAHFSREALRSNPLTYDGKNDSVFCAALHNPFDEADYIASSIRELVEREQYRFEEIAIIGRNLSEQAPILSAAFERYEIPYFLDRPESIDTMPLFRFVFHLLGFVQGKLDREEILSFLKCGMCDLTADEIHAFERYSYVWSVDHEQLKEPFLNNPAGLTGRRMKPQEAAELSRAESVRRRIAETGEHFAFAAQESVGKAIYQALTEWQVKETVTARISAAAKAGDEQTAAREQRGWEMLMAMLDTMEHAFAEQQMSLREYAELFRLSAAGISVGETPQTLDSVLIGSAERVRIGAKKAVFLCGANDRAFPYVPEEEGVLTDADRQILEKEGIMLNRTLEEKLIDERFVTYQALSAPSHRLVITYSVGDVAGKERFPSVLVGDFSRIFPQIQVIRQSQLSAEFFCRTPATLFGQYARRRGGDADDFCETAKEVLGEMPQTAEKLNYLQRGKRFLIEDPALRRKLFARNQLPQVPKGLHLSTRRFLEPVSLRGRDLSGFEQAVVSPSQVEQFYRCRFAFFCRYGLGLQADRRAAFDPRIRGNAIHELLCFVIGRVEDIRTVSDDVLDALIDEGLMLYLTSLFPQDDQPEKFLYFYHQTRPILHEIFHALKEEFIQAEFSISEIETSIGDRGNYPPLILPIDHSQSIKVIGKIDRVDRLQNDDGSWVRVIDYKSGGKEFSFDHAAQGLDLQMLLYLFAVTDHTGETPAGILYMPAGAPKPTLGRVPSETDTQKARDKNYAMNGLLLDDDRVLTAMEQDLSGRFLPISKGSKGKKGKYLADRHQMAEIRTMVYDRVTEMGQALFMGEIAPDPIKTGARLPCEYCDYRTICGHETMSGHRTVDKHPFPESHEEVQASDA